MSRPTKAELIEEYGGLIDATSIDFADLIEAYLNDEVSEPHKILLARGWKFIPPPDNSRSYSDIVRDGMSE